MKFKDYLRLSLLIILFSCKGDPTGLETGCHLNDLYVLDYHFVNASKVFDVRTDPPTEIKNGKLEHGLSYQLLLHFDDVTTFYPYSEYFIDSIYFPDPATAEVHIFETERSNTYSYTRDDCGLELTSPNGNLHLELTNSGDEIFEQRFAIYDHSSRRVTIDTLSFLSDTFSFIEFRLGAFLTYEDIIKQFEADYPGLYDTVAIELVQNKTRE